MKKKALTTTTKLKGHGEKYSRKAPDAIVALMSEPTIAAAAKKAAIGERTLRRWLRNPDFQEKYRDEQRHRLDAALRGLDEGAFEALDCLRSVLNYTLVDRDRLAAAKILLDAAFKKARLYDLGRLNRLDRKGQAPTEVKSFDAGAESQGSILGERTADAPRPMPLSRAAGDTPF